MDLLVKKGLKIIKIPSGEITNLPYLEKIGALGLKIILSTGMAKLGEIEKALEILEFSGTKKDDITVLHANTEYPTPLADVNLKAMRTIKKAFKVKVGYSDHTKGIEVPIAAVALGASVIEKHFTLDRALGGEDSGFSLNYDEFSAMAKAVKNAYKALGKVDYSFNELNRKYARSLFVTKDIKKGEILTPQNIRSIRPAQGLHPKYYDEVIGKKASKDLKFAKPLEFSDFE